MTTPSSLIWMTDDTFIMSPSSFAVALNEETFVANGTFADYLVINPSVMMKMNDV
jgi:hypothetical protein